MNKEWDDVGNAIAELGKGVEERNAQNMDIIYALKRLGDGCEKQEKTLLDEVGLTTNNDNGWQNNSSTTSECNDT